MGSVVGAVVVVVVVGVFLVLVVVRVLPGPVEKYWTLLMRRQALREELATINLEERRKSLREKGLGFLTAPESSDEEARRQRQGRRESHG